MSRGSGQVNLKFPLYIPLRGFRMRCSFALVFTQRQASKKTKFSLALPGKGRRVLLLVLNLPLEIIENNAEKANGNLFIRNQDESGSGAVTPPM
jgi:hypothetical protein